MGLHSYVGRRLDDHANVGIARHRHFAIDSSGLQAFFVAVDSGVCQCALGATKQPIARRVTAGRSRRRVGDARNGGGAVNSLWRVKRAARQLLDVARARRRQFAGRPAIGHR